MTDFDFFSHRTETIAEHIDLLIEAIKKKGSQNAASWNKANGIVIGIFDNNRDKLKAEDFEQHKKMANSVGIEIRRIRDGEYDWWISLVPATDPIEAMRILRMLAR